MGDAKEALERDRGQTEHDLPGLDGQDLDQDIDEEGRRHPLSLGLRGSQ